MLKLIHVIKHFGGEVLLCWFLFRIHAYLLFQAIGMLSCNELSSCRRRLFVCLCSATVKLLFFDFIIHFLVKDVIPVFKTVAWVLSDITGILFWFEIDYVIRSCLLVVDSHLIKLETSLSIVCHLRTFLKHFFIWYRTGHLYRMSIAFDWWHWPSRSYFVAIAFHKIASVGLFDSLRFRIVSSSEERHWILDIRWWTIW